MIGGWSTASEVWSAFLHAGLLDVLRTVLALGLCWAFWTIHFPPLKTTSLGQCNFSGESSAKLLTSHEIRPVADLVSWGVRYPFVFSVLTLCLLIIWGLIGRDYGLQGLFFDKNELIQFGMGATAALLMLQIIYQYYVLNNERPEVWLKLVQQTVLIGQIITGGRGGKAVFGAVKNGLLEELDSKRLATVYKALQVDLDRRASPGPHKVWSQEVGHILALPWMRLRFAPAVLTTNTTMIFVLLGVVPWLFYPIARLPWLLGVLCGTMAAVALAWLTTCILWHVKRRYAEGKPTTVEDESKQLLALLDDPQRAPQYVPGVEAAGRESRLASHQGNRIEEWITRLVVCFFVIHAFAYGGLLPLLSQHLTRRIGLSVPTDAATLLPPLRILVIELVLAVVLAIFLRGIKDRLSRGQVALMRACGAGMAWIVFMMSLVWVIPLVCWTYADRTGGPAACLLAGYLVFWISSFLIGVVGATWNQRDEGNAREVKTRKRNLSNVFVLLLLIAGFTTIVSWSEGFDSVIWFVCLPTMVLMFLRRWRKEKQSDNEESSRPGRTLLRVLAVALCTLGTLSAGWLLISQFGPTTALLLAFVCASAACLLPIWAGSRPGMIYPASVLFSYASFAILYNACTEEMQSGLPAAASFMMLLSVMAAISFVLRFSRRRMAPVGGLMFVLVVLIVNGNAWMVEPNHFKLQFPGLEAYYKNAWPRSVLNVNPVYLDSRAYFRSTTSSVVKLRDEALVKHEDERSGQVDSERPASATFKWLDSQSNIGNTLDLGLLDTRGRVRPATGDHLLLILPEVPLAHPTSVGKTWVYPIAKYSDLYPAGATSDEATRATMNDEFRRSYFALADTIRVRPYVPGSGDAKSSLTGAETFKRTATGKSFNINSTTDPPQLELTGLEGDPPTAILVALVLRADALDSDSKKKIIEQEKALASRRRPSTLKPEETANLDHINVIIQVQGSFAGALSLKGKESAEMHKRLRHQLDGSNLVLEREVWPLPSLENEKTIATFTQDHGLKEGDCVVLERLIPIRGLHPAGNSRDDSRSAVLARQSQTTATLETFVVGQNLGLTPDQFDDVGFNERSLKSWLDRYSKGTGDKQLDLSVRVAHTQGIFWSRPGNQGETKPEIILFRGDRVREHDRLLLRWRDPNSVGSLERCLCMEVSKLEPSKLPGSTSVIFELVDKASGTQRPAGGLVGRWDILMPLDNLQVLEAWRERMQALYRWQSEKNKERAQVQAVKPPLVIVTVSGGGIRASVWAGTVLERLEKELGNSFPYHIRLITGASGGMVSASQYAASLNEPTPASTGRGFSDLENLMSDQLDSVLGCLVFNDMPGLMNPLSRKTDRGKKLEETWHRLTSPADPSKSPLARSIRSYAADERCRLEAVAGIHANDCRGRSATADKQPRFVFPVPKLWTDPPRTRRHRARPGIHRRLDAQLEPVRRRALLALRGRVLATVSSGLGFPALDCHSHECHLPLGVPGNQFADPAPTASSRRRLLRQLRSKPGRAVDDETPRVAG